MDNSYQIGQIEIILPKQKCLEQALSLRVGVIRLLFTKATTKTSCFLFGNGHIDLLIGSFILRRMNRSQMRPFKEPWLILFDTVIWTLSENDFVLDSFRGSYVIIVSVEKAIRYSRVLVLLQKMKRTFLHPCVASRNYRCNIIC